MRYQEYTPPKRPAPKPPGFVSSVVDWFRKVVIGCVVVIGAMFLLHMYQVRQASEPASAAAGHLRSQSPTQLPHPGNVIICGKIGKIMEDGLIVQCSSDLERGFMEDAPKGPMPPGTLATGEVFLVYYPDPTALKIGDHIPNAEATPMGPYDYTNFSGGTTTLPAYRYYAGR